MSESAAPADPSPSSARPTPDIPDSADEDVPPDGGGSVVPAPPDPDGDHRRTMDGWKVKFAFWLIGCCLGLAIILTLVETFFRPPELNEFGGMIDLLKLVGTTALGFVFGRSLGQGEK